jgi:hypothetical protein
VLSAGTGPGDEPARRWTGSGVERVHWQCTRQCCLVEI